MIFKTAATFAALASLMAIAQADMLSISNPTKGTTWKVADTVFLQWKGNCASMGAAAAKSVDVNLMSGPDTALRFVAKLASIDCSGSETRKEFVIPADVVVESGNYSLQVQTEPQLSYSNIFSIETAGGSGGSGGTGGVGAGAGVGAGDGGAGTATPEGPGRSSAATGLLQSRGAAAAVGGMAIAVAAQFLVLARLYQFIQQATWLFFILCRPGLSLTSLCKVALAGSFVDTSGLLSLYYTSP